MNGKVYKLPPFFWRVSQNILKDLIHLFLRIPLIIIKSPLLIFAAAYECWHFSLRQKAPSTTFYPLIMFKVARSDFWRPKDPSSLFYLSLSLQSAPEFNAAKRAIHWIWENSVNSGENDQTDKGKKSQKKYPYAVPKLPLPPPPARKFWQIFHLEVEE